MNSAVCLHALEEKKDTGASDWPKSRKPQWVKYTRTLKVYIQCTHA